MDLQQHKLWGRVCLVTGVTGCLGHALVEGFLENGATVAAAVRHADQIERDPVLASSLRRHHERLKTCVGDLCSPHAAESMVEQAIEKCGRVDVLVNNAGIQGPIGPLEENSPEEWINTLMIDLIGPVALCRTVLAGMKARRRGKIINLSGGGATGPRANFSAYATAKAGLTRFSETLARETRDFGIDVNCIAPGFMRSRMTEETLAAGPKKAGAGELAQIEKLTVSSVNNPKQAAALAVWLASAASDGISGRLISAVWDPWEDLANHAWELKESDIYTLRRIVPRDRGLDWGER